MAKDGTARGGTRAGAGRKSKALVDKIKDGNPGGRKLTVVELPVTANMSGAEMPEPSEYLKAKQKNGGEFAAEDIYKEQLIEQYAVSVSRFQQCEQAISEYGFLAKHPTTGSACASPYVTMSQQYMKQVTQIWYQIFQVVKENCSSEFNPQDEDPMEMLLRARR